MTVLGNPQENRSRFAELATELMGAKAIAEFMREAWAMASPEAKRELANALLKRLGGPALEENWAVKEAASHVVSEVANAAAKQLVEKRREEIEKATVAAYVARFPEHVAETAKRALDKALEELREKFLAREVREIQFRKR